MNQKFLIGRKGFFFDPPTDANGNQSGQASGGGNGGGEPAQSNSQQQQPQSAVASAEFISPFKGIDMNLVDDQTRETIQKAEQTMRDYHGRAQQASKYQSERDQAAQQVQTLSDHLQLLQKAGKPTGQQQQQQQQAPSLEEELEAILIEGGMNAAAAKQTAAIQAKMQGALASRIEARVGQRFAPVVGNVIEQNATTAFEQVKGNDPLGILSTPEIAERVWQRTLEISRDGTLITPQVVQNLARIYYIEHLEANGNQAPQIQNHNRMNQPSPLQQQSTRFTFPGAGSHAQLPTQSQANSGDAIDPETFAALAATTERWPVQPERFKGKGANGGKFHVTRGGV